MSRQFSIFTKGIALVLVLVMLVSLAPPVLASGSDPCKAERDRYWHAFREMLALGAIAIGVCSPASLATIAGAIACAGATAAYFNQAAEVRRAHWALQACERKHEPN